MNIGKKRKKQRNPKRILRPEETPERFVIPIRVPDKEPVKVPLVEPKKVNVGGS
jgi:hypothetical protein